MSLTAVTVGLLVAYFASLKWIATWAHRQGQRTAEDFYLAGRGVGVAALAATLVASAVNSLAVTGTPALLYRGGILYAQMFVVVTGAAILIWALGPRISAEGRSAGVITQGEYFAHHYGSKLVHGLVTLVGLLAILPFMAVQIAGTGKVLSGLSAGAVSYELAVGLSAASIAVYIFFGGARAVVRTDVLQGLVALGFLLLSAVLFCAWTGGISSNLDRLARLMPQKLAFDAVTLPLFVDAVLSWTFAILLFPQMFQRLFMARRAARIRPMAGLSLGLLLLIVGCIFVMALAATVELHGTLADPDQLIVAFYARHWPAGGVMLTVVIFALAMSTADSMLLTTSSSVTRDGLRGLLGVTLTARQEFSLARWVTLGVLAIGTAVALTGIGQGAIVPWVTVSASMATLLLWPLLGTLWSGATRAGVVAAMGLGFLAICLVRFSELGRALPVGFATVGFFVGAASFLGVSFLTARDQKRAAG